MMLSISDARPKFVAQLHPAPVRASELRALYNPSFKTGRTLLNTSGGVAALGVATICLEALVSNWLWSWLCVQHLLLAA
ncbi:MAG: hypothetical protein LBI34_00340 [Puniceicoccales bacterium]|nr:hypothetical protein [Puniceicoccales bacterium]